MPLYNLALHIGERSEVVVDHGNHDNLAQVVKLCRPAHVFHKQLLVLGHAACVLTAQIAYQQPWLFLHHGADDGRGYLCHVHRVGIGGQVGGHDELFEEGDPLFGLQVSRDALVDDQCLEHLYKLGGVLVIVAVSERRYNMSAQQFDRTALLSVGDIGNVVEVEYRVILLDEVCELFVVEPYALYQVPVAGIPALVGVQSFLCGDLLEPYLHEQHVHILLVVYVLLLLVALYQLGHKPCCLLALHRGAVVEIHVAYQQLVHPFCLVLQSRHQTRRDVDGRVIEHEAHGAHVRAQLSYGHYLAVEPSKARQIVEGCDATLLVGGKTLALLAEHRSEVVV